MLQVLACGQIGAFAPSWNPLSIKVPPATHHPLPRTGGILPRFKDVIPASTVSQLLGKDAEMKKALHSLSKVVLRQGSQVRAFLKWNSWRGPTCYILLKDHTSFLCPWPKCLNLGLTFPSPRPPLGYLAISGGILGASQVPQWYRIHCQGKRRKRCGFDPWITKIHLEGEMSICFISWKPPTCQKKISSADYSLEKSLKSTDNTILRLNSDFIRNFLEIYLNLFFFFALLSKVFWCKMFWTELEEIIIQVKILKYLEILIIMWQ